MDKRIFVLECRPMNGSSQEVPPKVPVYQQNPTVCMCGTLQQNVEAYDAIPTSSRLSSVRVPGSRNLFVRRPDKY
jgi:hypothetical protein